MRVLGQRFHAPDARLTRAASSRLSRTPTEWHGFDAGHLWSLWTRYACTAFYSHPWAWNEMGFGGPAYPRGYKNIGHRPARGVGAHRTTTPPTRCPGRSAGRAAQASP